MTRGTRLGLAVAALLMLVPTPSRTVRAAGAPPLLQAGAAAAQQAGADTREGVLQILWADPRPGSTAGGTTQFNLVLDDGSVLPLQLGDQQASAVTFFNKRVTVSGRASDPAATAAAGAAPAPFVVTSIAKAAGADSAATDTAQLVSGTKKVLFLLLQFKDDSTAGRALPHAPSFYASMTNPDTPPGGLGLPTTINGFFKKVSNSQFYWTGEVGGMGGVGAPGGWIVLPNPKSYYAPCGFSSSCFSISNFNTDAVTLAKQQGIVFTNYDTVNFVVSNDLDCCAWGGGTSIDGKSYGATWEPPWGQETRVYSHELGHSLGLPHSGWVYFAYDSPWDVMSGYSDVVATNCGTYASANASTPYSSSTLYCREPGNGYIAPHRDYLGWIPSVNEVITDTNSVANVVLEGAALPMATGIKMIKICLPGVPCTGSGAHYFTVEARVKDGTSNTLFDHGIPGEGVIIHDVLFGRSAITGACFFNNQSGWAVPVDATPGDFTGSPTCNGTGLGNAQFLAGQTYTNSTYHFKVTVGSRVGQTFNVTVTGTSVSELSIDAPAAGSVTVPFAVNGWALNRFATSGTGVDAVHVYATPAGGGASTFIGAASYGQPRSDVAGIFGAQFLNSGWNITVSSLPIGSYTLVAYVHNVATGTFDSSQSRSITVTPAPTNPTGSIDLPAGTVPGSFLVSGWAIDRGAPAGTGIDAVHVYAVPSAGSAVFLGVATYGQARADVGGIFGSRFTNSGYSLSATGLAPGNYTLVVYMHSTLSGVFSSQTRSFTVRTPGSPVTNIDVPAAGGVIPGHFLVAGWAVDFDSQSGPGVDAVHVYAVSSGGSAVFLGVATYGQARADVGGAFGSRFTNSGYSLNASGLAPDTYTLIVYAHSTVSGTFTSQIRSFTVRQPGSPAMSIDVPAPSASVTGSFLVGGWAIDLDAPSGSGVDAVHVWAYPSAGGSAVFVGAGTPNAPRGDVGASFGAQFANSGYNVPVPAATLAPGTYVLVVYAHSTVTGTFNQSRTVTVTVH